MNTKKTKRAKAVPWIICAAGLIVLLLSGYMCIILINDYSKSQDLYEELFEEYVSIPATEEVAGKEAEKETERETGWEDLADVDITGLSAINEDIAGWIYFENVDINYPVMYSGDNSKYLRRTYTGENLSSGSIFIEEKNNRDFSDVHTILYGHNMNDLSMFGKLRYYVTKADYLENHQFFQIITEEEKYRYKIISCKLVKDTDEIYTVYKSGSNDFVDFVKENILAGSNVEGNYDVSPNDHVITLSTCFRDDRLVVSAIRCEGGTW